MRFMILGLAALFAWNALAFAQEKGPRRVAPAKLKAAFADADAVFVGKIVEADLTEGYKPGYLGIHAKRVVYEVSDPIKGKPGKKVEAWLMLQPLETPEYLAPKGVKLDPQLFAKGTVHVVYCLSEKQAVGNWKLSIGFVWGAGKAGDRVFALMVTPDVEAAKAEAVTSRAVPAPGDKSKAPREWEIALTAKGGNLFAEEKIKITAKDGVVTGWRLRTSALGVVSKSQAHIPAAAVTQLWQTLEKVNAMELPDFEKRVLDSPDFTITFTWSGKSRTITVKGASKSPPHLEVTLAIEKCFDMEAAK